MTLALLALAHVQDNGHIVLDFWGMVLVCWLVLK